MNKEIRPHVERHSVTPIRATVALFFTTLMVLCTVLGAIPFQIQTPLGVVSTEVQTAYANNTTGNRLRSLTITNTGARRHESFSVNRNTYRIEVRQSTNHMNARFGLRSGQQVRWRIDTRNQNGNWVNGSYNAWRARTTSNTTRDIRVNVSEGIERRLRLQIRDRNNRTRTVTLNIQRASGETRARLVEHGQIRTSVSPAFSQTTHSYTMRQHRNEPTSWVSMAPRQERAMIQGRVRTQNSQGAWGSWGSWTTYRRGTLIMTAWSVPQGKQAEIQFRVRGAWTNRNNTPLRTRTYTFRITRDLPPVQNVTVTFNAQGGSVSPTSRTIPANTAIGTLPTPTRANHTFDGWWTVPVHGGQRITTNTTFNSNTTVHARWIWNPQQVTITFNPQGGTVSPTTRVVNSGMAIGELPWPTRPGFIFEGWYTTATAGGQRATASSNFTSSTTIFARWRVNPDSNQGTTYNITRYMVWNPFTASSNVPSGFRVIQVDIVYCMLCF